MSNDDADWLEEIKTIKPIKKQNKAKIKTKKLLDTEVDDFEDFVYSAGSKTSQNSKKQDYQSEQVLVNEYSQQVQNQQPFRIHSNIASKISASRASLDSKTMKKLSQGKIPFEAKIDLHGFYLDDAWGALMDFINKSAINNLRCVLVVHGKGKGYGPKKDMGIIKSQVNGWLLGQHNILAYHTAIPRHGGNGALYVLLKRQN